MSRYAWAAVALVVGATSLAEAQGRGGPQAPQVTSPEVSADRRISFRIYAPQAREIRLAASDIPGLGQNMVRDWQGGFPPVHHGRDGRSVQAPWVLAGLRPVARRPHVDQLAELPVGVRAATLSEVEAATIRAIPAIPSTWLRRSSTLTG